MRPFLDKLAHATVTIAIMLGLALTAFAWAGCGATARERTLQATLVTVNAAADGLVAWDAAHQAAIVQAATDIDEGREQLATYRTARQKILDGFSLVYRAIAVAAIAKDDPVSLATLTKVAAQLIVELRSFTGGKVP